MAFASEKAQQELALETPAQNISKAIGQLLNRHSGETNVQPESALEVGFGEKKMRILQSLNLRKEPVLRPIWSLCGLKIQLCNVVSKNSNRIFRIVISPLRLGLWPRLRLTFCKARDFVPAYAGIKAIKQ
jgi:hypothetical protein